MWAFLFVSATCFAWIIWCACEGRWGYSYWWSSHKWRCWPCNWDSKFPGTVLCVLVYILLTLGEIFRLHSCFQLLHMLFALTFRILLCYLGWFWDWWVRKLTAVALTVLQALLQALGDRKGINRFGDFSAPLDEALVHVSLVRYWRIFDIFC